METAHELFVHELNDMLDAERKILDALEENIEQSDRPELKKAFESHRAQTEKQIERLEQCFEELDEEQEPTECKGMKGLVEEKESFMEEEPSEELIDFFNIGAACKVEHYEIAAYSALIDMAQKMGHRGALRLLQQNLKEEQQMLKRCEAFLKKFKPEHLMEEEEGEEVEVEQAPRRRRGRKAA
jgi:ferritin-like metal-binding protein YciE